MKNLVKAALLAAGLMVGWTGVNGGGTATAQTISRIIADTGLSPDDFSLMSEAGRQLYDVAAPRVGREKTWSNPDTGSHGVAHLAALQQGCASLQNVFYPKGAAQGREFRTRFCKTAEGKWVLQP